MLWGWNPSAKVNKDMMWLGLCTYNYVSWFCCLLPRDFLLLAIYLISVDCFSRDFFSQKKGGGGQFEKKNLMRVIAWFWKKIGGRGGSETNKLPFNVVEIIHYFLSPVFLYLFLSMLLEFICLTVQRNLFLFVGWKLPDKVWVHVNRHTVWNK